MPARVRIRDLEKDQLPKSDSARFAEGWTLERWSEEELKVVAARMASTHDKIVRNEERGMVVKPVVKTLRIVNAPKDDSPF